MARPSLDGQRVHFILPHRHVKKLDALVKKTGLLRSEIIRRAVEAYLAKAEGKK